MNFVDLILILTVLLCIYSGWRKGFILSSLQLLCWLGSLFLAFYFYKHAAAFLERYLNFTGVWLMPVAFLCCFILGGALLSLIKNAFLRTTPGHAHNNGLNKFLGIIPGIINGIIYAVVIIMLFLSLPIMDGLSAKTRESRIGKELLPKAEWLDDRISPVFDKAINRTLNKLTVEPGSEESVDLNLSVKNAVPRPDLEAAMLVLVNEERTSRGLTALKPDPELTEVARAHSRDMLARGYFSHNNPEGKTPFDRMNESNIKYRSAGENLAYGQTLAICHTGLMNSPGHKANILRNSFGRLGIGILDAGKYGLMISQEFRD